MEREVMKFLVQKEWQILYKSTKTVLDDNGKIYEIFLLQLYKAKFHILSRDNMDSKLLSEFCCG